MMRKALWILVLPAVLLLASLASCKKDVDYELNGELGFTNDTLIFDTVFTTVGSVTKRFNVFNPSGRRLKIDRIELAGGSASVFRVNVDGISGTKFYNLELEGGDSLFVFVEVTLNVNGGTFPMIVEDSLIFQVNGKQQSVKLVVWGQDAYFHVNELVSGTWPVDKPHVVYGVAAVGYPGLDSNQTLTIPAGGRVHFHKNSQLIVYKSTLQVQGTEGNEVYFGGDRLDPYYRDLPGQWGGIYLLMSNNSTIEHAEIENATTAIRSDTVFVAGTPALTVRKTTIENNTFAGIIGLGSHIVAENCLIADAGYYCAYLGWGGTYQFNHCTMANYYSANPRSTPSVVLNNWYESASGNVIRDLNATYIRNSVIFGGLEEEFALDTLQYGIKDYHVAHTVLKTTDLALSNPGFYTSVYRNSDPGFANSSEANYQLVSGSFARGKADVLTALPDDLNEVLRDASPDAGCYEFQ